MSIGGSACHRPIIDVDKTRAILEKGVLRNTAVKTASAKEAYRRGRLDPATVVPALGASALALVKVDAMDYFGHLVPHLIHAEAQFPRQS